MFCSCCTIHFLFTLRFELRNWFLVFRLCVSIQGGKGGGEKLVGLRAQYNMSNESWVPPHYDALHRFSFYVFYSKYAMC